MYQQTIEQLYLESNIKLLQVMEIMARDHNFKASVKMYKRRLTRWKADGKNLKRNQVKQIGRRKVERDAVGLQSSFLIKGREIDMKKVLRYVRKHGFQSLEDFMQAASPSADGSEVSCYTPDSIPTPVTVQSEYLDLTNNLEQQDGRIVQRGESRGYSKTSTSHDSPASWCVQHHQSLLSLSPESRSRILLSLSPVTRPPLLPTVHLLPERLLSSFDWYLQRGFEAGIGRQGRDGGVESGSNPGDVSPIGIITSCRTSAELLHKQSYVQARQVLSQLFAEIERRIKFYSATLIDDILCGVVELQLNNFHDISAMMMRHGASTASQLFGSHHPVTLFFHNMLKLGTLESVLEARLRKYHVDYLQKSLGKWHLETLEIRCRFIDALDTAEAVEQSHRLIRECKAVCVTTDLEWLLTMDHMAWTMFHNKQYEEAERISQGLFDAANAARVAVASAGMYKVRALYHLSLCRLKSDDIIAAENYIRCCIDEGAALEGRSNSEALGYMIDRVDLLHKLERTEEAYNLQREIDQMLGPPEIKELLD